MNPDEDYKNKVGERLTRRLAQALQTGQITEEELPTISSYILENIDNAKNNSEVLEFIEDISQKWPFFSDILITEQTETAQNKEENKDQKVQEVSELLKQNKIDDALKVAEDANNQSGNNGGVN